MRTRKVIAKLSKWFKEADTKVVIAFILSETNTPDWICWSTDAIEDGEWFLSEGADEAYNFDNRLWELKDAIIYLQIDTLPNLKTGEVYTTKMALNFSDVTKATQLG